MSIVSIFCFVFLFDVFLGELKWLWNCVFYFVVLMGKVVFLMDIRLNIGVFCKFKGVFVVVVFVIGGWIIGCVIFWFGWLFILLVVVIFLV